MTGAEPVLVAHVSLSRVVTPHARFAEAPLRILLAHVLGLVGHALCGCCRAEATGVAS
jgi:hypothetical protein